MDLDYRNKCRTCRHARNRAPEVAHRKHNETKGRFIEIASNAVLIYFDQLFNALISPRQDSRSYGRHYHSKNRGPQDRSPRLQLASRSLQSLNISLSYARPSSSLARAIVARILTRFQLTKSCCGSRANRPATTRHVLHLTLRLPKAGRGIRTIKTRLSLSNRCRAAQAASA